MQVNAIGVYYGSRVAMSHFVKQRQGKLINLLGTARKALAFSERLRFQQGLGKEFHESPGS